ncbi:TonB-dependent receptor [Winogradskyella sp.]|jgi:outer membrane receptor for ferrienterochelin and colicins|uniref:TonB-dependent receptor n=1 Tax=Winogradskyella sp. TaxID=1883156 RepID=UPI0025EE6B26|nr:TonB-dependent receptor [Winogradskyella sp.]MCT4629562.1 TonB-dependent receptor [Winogradskyella sp.]
MSSRVLLVILATLQFAYAQSKHTISGYVTSNGTPLTYANIYLETTPTGAVSRSDGFYELKNIETNTYTIVASMTGYKTQRKQIKVDDNLTLNFDLETESLDEVVITGTRTFKRKTNSAVIVNILNSESLNTLQACNLSDGLKFQPGLRVETDCQTCNYTQLRINGLGGGYSQILINGRPIFSPLTGLYGLEQIPVNMIERIETIRGGGSSLYGSSAIGGVVNVITKVPKTNNFDVNYTYQNINGGADDHMVSGNATVVSKSKNAGVSLFINNRNRDMYDHNDDNFSELTTLKNNSFGANFFFLPSENQKLEASFSKLNEYRYGGEMIDGPAYLTQQAEERTHDVIMGSLDYQINFNNNNSSLITYFAGQQTDRDHYTGVFPDDTNEIEAHISNPPYGTSKTVTLQGGAQFNHRLNNFFNGSNVLTIGSEYLVDDVQDVIESYNYNIDQTTKNLGTFFQSDWEITPKLNLLSGFRVDSNNLVDNLIVSPRFSLLYKSESNVQLRATWSTGFRAPQAFDTDLHIAFAGGGISRVSLDDDLVEERSNSFSASINYDKASEKFIAGFTLEGFYTKLKDAFYLNPIGEDEFGQLFEKQNGDAAAVQGITLEARANYNKKVQLEAGFTIQKSEFDTAVETIEGLNPRREFLRTPNHYGFATLSYMPNNRFNTNLNYVYTGDMLIAHFAGAPEQLINEYKTTASFHEFSWRSSYRFNLNNLNTGLEIFGGVKNIFNAYQNDFDTGKNRDSNYVYGPGMPRTFFIGLKVLSI